ncbi:MAG: hypothetical protein P9M12_02085 [Candidatus Aceula lacicola]|nr:hypothetical protein [Candidatus Aceula lacicola]
MRQKIVLFLFIFLIGLFLINGILEASESFNLTAAQTRNPFKSSLPKIKEIVEKIPEPINISSRASKLRPELRTSPIQVEKKPKPIVKAPVLVISGLIWNTALPQAIINQNIVTIGDIVEKSEIVNIHKGGVDILFSGAPFTIKIDQTLTQSI